MPSLFSPRDADLGWGVRKLFAPKLLCCTWIAGLAAMGMARAEAIRPVGVTVVIAEPEEALASDEAASKSAVTPENSPRALPTLAQLLSESPGVSLTRTGGLGSSAMMSIRGSAPNQVVVFLEGVPYSSSSVVGADIGRFMIGPLDHVEVFRGQTPMAFPASGIGGIVSLTARRPDRSYGLVRMGMGSFRTLHGDLSVAHVSPKNSITLLAQGLRSEGDFPYRDDQGTYFVASDDVRALRQNNALAEGQGRLRWASDVGEGRSLTVIVGIQGREQGLPGPGHLASRAAQSSTRQWLGTAYYRSTRDLGRNGALRLQIHALGASQRLSDPYAEVATVPSTTHDQGRAYGGTLTLEKMMLAWWRWSWVAAIAQESFHPSSNAQPSAPQGTRANGVIGSEWDFSWEAHGLHVLPSVRWEGIRDTPAVQERYAPNVYAPSAPSSRGFTVLRLAITRALGSRIALRGNVGRYARMPSQLEQYGNSGWILGNATLRPEVGLNADLGAQGSAGWGEMRFRWNMAVFGAKVRDLIQFQMIPPRMRPENVGAARVWGMEAEMEGLWGAYGRLLGHATFTDARNQSGRSGEQGHQLPLRPRLRAYARPELQNLPLGAHLRAGIFGDVDVTAGQYQDAANMRGIPARVLLSSGVAVELPALGLRCLLTMENLLNTPTHDLAGYPMPGRSLFLSLAWKSGLSQAKEI